MACANFWLSLSTLVPQIYSVLCLLVDLTRIHTVIVWLFFETQQLVDVRCRNTQLFIDRSKVTLGDCVVNINSQCALFVTLNPTYAGRAQLPDNLKALFRPIAMVKPDLEDIIAVSLYSSGYIKAKQ